MRKLFWIGLIGLLISPCHSFAQSSTVGVVVSSEIAKAMTQLHEPGYPLPYFISINVSDVDNWDSECDMGALNWSEHWRGRSLFSDIRVGSYALDNHQNPSPLGILGSWISLDDDSFALKHDLWLGLDDSYKSAAAQFLRKEALRVRNGKREYDTDDLSHEPAAVFTPAFPPLARGVVSYRKMRKLCRNLSQVFAQKPSLIQGNVSIERRRILSRFYNSGGTRIHSFLDVFHTQLNIAAISKDGMKLYVARNFVSLSSATLESESPIKSQAQQMISEMDSLLVASSTSPFNAPALIDPSVTSAIVLSLGLNFSGEAERNPSGAQIFRGKVGKIVFSRDLTLIDDPLDKFFNETPLVGSYSYDAEGVKARKVLLVRNGRLKNFLLSRYPVIGFPRSNGHARGDVGSYPRAMPSNLFLEARQGYSQAKLMKILRKELRKEGKPYGLWIGQMRAFTQENSASGEESLRIMPELVYLVNAKTGKRTLVRGLDLVGTPLGFLNHVLGAGKDMTASNHLLGWVPISVVSPSLLLSQVELQRSKEAPVKPPILPAPRALTEK